MFEVLQSPWTAHQHVQEGRSMPEMLLFLRSRCLKSCRAPGQHISMSKRVSACQRCCWFLKSSSLRSCRAPEQHISMCGRQNACEAESGRCETRCACASCAASSMRAIIYGNAGVLTSPDGSGFVDSLRRIVSHPVPYRDTKHARYEQLVDTATSKTSQAVEGSCKALHCCDSHCAIRASQAHFAHASSAREQA